MVQKSIFLYTGIKRHEITINTDSMMADIRDKITDSNIIMADNTQGKLWRFVTKVMKIDLNQVATIHFTDCVMGRDMEALIQVGHFLRGSNVIYMADVNKDTPDLFGLRTNEFINGHVKCFITRNESASPNKFNPIMLERVRALKNITVGYNNVVVCEEDTAIQICLIAKGHSAFGYSIRGDTEEFVVEDLYALKYYNDYGGAAVSATRYEKQEKNITVQSVPANLTRNQKLIHQRFTITLWKVNSFKKNNETIIVQNSSERYRREKKDRIGYDLPRETIRPGTFAPGSHSDEKFVTISDIDEDKDDILGIIALDVFVFKSIEDANKVFEINATAVEF